MYLFYLNRKSKIHSLFYFINKIILYYINYTNQNKCITHFHKRKRETILAKGRFDKIIGEYTQRQGTQDINRFIEENSCLFTLRSIINFSSCARMRSFSS